VEVERRSGGRGNGGPPIAEMLLPMGGLRQPHTAGRAG
jgi:hypothetical protein